MRPSTTAALAARVLVAALLLAAIGAFGFYATALLLKYPPVWPDESLFADPAIGLLRRGVMGTELLAGIIPGIDQRTYWMPPLYYMYVWAVFAVWGPGVVSMRLSSVATAIAVMILTYAVGCRAGLGRWLSLIPVSLLAVDAVFLRAALIGRMDMLALAFILMALWLALGSSSSGGSLTSRRSFLSGVACALAALAHPVGAVAAATVVVVWSLFSQGPRHPILTPMLAGILLPMLPWAVYILQDPGNFAVQFGGQMVRKAARDPLALNSLLGALRINLSQYGTSQGLVGLLWIGGLVGLFGTAFRRRELVVLPACQVVTLAVILWSQEMWYPVYLAPLTSIGLGCLMGLTRQWISWRGIPAIFAAVLSVWFAQSNLRHASNMHYIQNTLYGDVTNYTDWCSKISDAIPSGSRVLLSIIPDPYLGLIDRSDLTFRAFAPEGIPVDREQYWRIMEDSDYIVVGRWSPSREIAKFVQIRGELVEEIGPPIGEGYYARIYRITK